MAKIFTNNNKLMTIGNSFLCKYEPPLYNITYSQVTGGTLSGPATAHVNDTVNVTATPNTDYSLDYITVNGSQITGTSFSMPAQNSVVSGLFKRPPQLQYRKVVSTPQSFGRAQYPIVLINGYQGGYQYVAMAYEVRNGYRYNMDYTVLNQLLTTGYNFNNTIEVYLSLFGVNSVNIVAGQAGSNYLPQFVEVYNVYDDSSEVLVNSKTLNEQSEYLSVTFS
jgi:hypothetical protein